MLLAKKYLLDISTIEALELENETGAGLAFLAGDPALSEKMNTGFMDKHPDAPKDLVLTEEDKEAIEEAWKNYLSAIKTSTVLCEIFDRLDSDDGKQAALMGAKSIAALEEIPLAQRKAIFGAPAQITGDQFKLSLIKLTHLINRDICKREFEKLPEYFESIIFILQTRFKTTPQDNHVKQIRINLNSTLGYARPALGNFATEFERFLKIIESEDFACDLDESWEPKYPESIEEALQHLEESKEGPWTENLSENHPCVTFPAKFKNFKEKLGPWIDIHRAIYKSTSQPWTGDRFVAHEKAKTGVDIVVDGQKEE